MTNKIAEQPVSSINLDDQGNIYRTSDQSCSIQGLIGVKNLKNRTSILSFDTSANASLFQETVNKNKEILEWIAVSTKGPKYSKLDKRHFLFTASGFAEYNEHNPKDPEDSELAKRLLFNKEERAKFNEQNAGNYIGRKICLIPTEKYPFSRSAFEYLLSQKTDEPKPHATGYIGRIYNEIGNWVPPRHPSAGSFNHTEESSDRAKGPSSTPPPTPSPTPSPYCSVQEKISNFPSPSAASLNSLPAQPFQTLYPDLSHLRQCSEKEEIDPFLSSPIDQSPLPPLPDTPSQVSKPASTERPLKKQKLPTE